MPCPEVGSRPICPNVLYGKFVNEGRLTMSRKKQIVAFMVLSVVVFLGRGMFLRARRTIVFAYHARCKRGLRSVLSENGTRRK